jgi:hypothetical protein
VSSGEETGAGVIGIVLSGDCTLGAGMVSAIGWGRARGAGAIGIGGGGGISTHLAWRRRAFVSVGATLLEATRGICGISLAACLSN